KLQYLEGILTDITERKLVEQALRESIQFNEEVISDAVEGIVVYDRNLHYILWNPFMERMTGLSSEDVIGRYAPDLFPHLKEQGVIHLLERALAGERVKSHDVPYRVPQTGKTGWVLGTYGPHRNSRGEITGVIGIINDITERK